MAFFFFRLFCCGIFGGAPPFGMDQIGVETEYKVGLVTANYVWGLPMVPVE